MFENLEERSKGYVYYVHSLYPLDIDVEETETEIEITVRKFYKAHEVKKLTKTSKKVGVMTKQQKEEFILDVIDIFLRK